MSLADDAKRLFDLGKTGSATTTALVSIARSLEQLVELGRLREQRERFFLAESGIDLDGLFAHYASGRPIDDVALDPDGPLS